ncbi:hypothetical protein EXIGLDRAFT_729201 [Exidia glandulosa HHB12029]|uniref:Uncharacterized protein n=1 Tax=Exidia glandulosa HHB12029 TaxID=1314781 RepID=A0A165LLW7_EXIGL|nr:hypothetical protein EXIGLDRAFT_729201 [Exidia glandulosa HHB12029]
MADWFIRPNQKMAPSTSATGNWKASTILRAGLMALLSVPRSTTDATFGPFFAPSLTASINGNAVNTTELGAWFNDLAGQVADAASVQFSAFEDISTAGVCDGSLQSSTSTGAASVQFTVIGQDLLTPLARNISMTVWYVICLSGRQITASRCPQHGRLPGRHQ